MSNENELDETSIPLEPLALLVYSDGSSRVTSIEEAVAAMEEAEGSKDYFVESYAFMGAKFELDREEVEDEPGDTEE